MRPPASRFPASVVIKPDHPHPLNVTEKQKYSETMHRRRRRRSSSSPKLFLILRDIKYQYCLYQICDPENNDESSIPNLGKPFLKMDKSTYPECMSFVALGKRIYMVGGYQLSGINYTPSNKMFICDTSSHTIFPGPNLVSGKVNPVLLTLGSKIYALTCKFFRPGPTHFTRERNPGLEVFDTKNPERGWSVLPAPPVRFLGDTMKCDVIAYAAVPPVVGGDGTCSSAIFITLSNYPGTFAYDVDNKVWDYVSEFNLPFSDYAMPMPSSPNLPCAPFLCFALSSKTERRRFSAFRFWYNANSRMFKVDEIKISNSSVLSRELPPYLYYVWPLTALGRFGRVYSIQVGTDNANAANDPDANRYVKVNVAEICTIKPRTRSHIRNEEMENDENVSFNSNLNRERTSKRSRTTKLIRNNEEDAGEFKMSKIWSGTFFGGVMVETRESISGAFAL